MKEKMYHPNKYLAAWNIFLLISHINVVLFPPVKVALPFKGQIFLAFDFHILYSVFFHYFDSSNLHNDMHFYFIRMVYVILKLEFSVLKSLLNLYNSSQCNDFIMYLE